jgi:GNAT superfamily N-acetyltransferase
MEEILLADLSLPPHGEAIIYLLNEYAKDEMGGGTELSIFVKNNLVSELKKRQGFYIILAFVDGHPAGLVNCFEGFSTFACKPLLNIHDVFVIAEYRGRGISKKMLNKAEEIAISLDCCKLTLEVLEGNTIAQMAYKSCGYSGYELNPKMGKAMFWQKKLIN